MHTPHPTDHFCYQKFRAIPCRQEYLKIIIYHTAYSTKYFERRTAGSNEIKNANQNISKACE